MPPIINLFGIEPYSEEAFEEALKSYYPGTLEQKRLAERARGKLNDVGVQSLLFNRFNDAHLFQQSLQSPEEAECFKHPQGPNHPQVALLEDIFIYCKNAELFSDSHVGFDISSIYTDNSCQKIEFRGMYGKFWGERTVFAASYDAPGTKLWFQGGFPREFSKIAETGNPLAEGPCDTLFKAYIPKGGVIAIPIPNLTEVGSHVARKLYTSEGIKPFPYKEEEIFRI